MKWVLLFGPGLVKIGMMVSCEQDACWTGWLIFLYAEFSWTDWLIFLYAGCLLNWSWLADFLVCKITGFLVCRMSLELIMIGWFSCMQEVSWTDWLIFLSAGCLLNQLADFLVCRMFLELTGWFSCMQDVSRTDWLIFVKLARIHHWDNP